MDECTHPSRCEMRNDLVAERLRRQRLLLERPRAQDRAENARTGAQIQELMERTYRSPPAVIERLRQLNMP